MKIQGVDGGTLRDVAVDDSGRVVLSPTSGTSTVADGSGTIAAGGTAQNLFGGATPATGFSIYNPGTSSLWFSKSGTAAPSSAGSTELAPGGLYETPPEYTPNHAISIYGGVTGQPFTAERW